MLRSKLLRCSRTDARKIMVAVSIARTQYTSLNQAGSARISSRAG